MKPNNTQPPRWIFRLLKSFCPPSLFEEIEGDLMEKYERDLQSPDHTKWSGDYRLRRAKRKLLWSVIRFFRPGIILRNKLIISSISFTMIKNYFLILFRNMIKQKLHSAITILGLTVGITFALLIGVFVWGELQVNENITDINRIHLLEQKEKGNDGNMLPVFVPALLASEAVNQYPTVFENFYRFRDRNITVSKGEKHFRIQSMIGDSTLLPMFGFPVLYGSSSHALTSPNAIVVTEKIAKQFFNKSDVVGETLTISTEVKGLRDYVITAVLADMQKKNSVSDFMNMDAQVFLSQNSREDFNLGFADDWNTGIITYIKLKKGASQQQAFELLNKILKANAPKEVSADKTIELNPLQNYYLVTNHSAVQKMIVSLSVIVIFIMTLAVVNFVNITIASSFSRMKEIGVRKVIGGLKSQIIIQFLSEAVTMSMISGIFSLVGYQLLHGYFGEVLSTPLPELYRMSFQFWICIITLFFVIGLMAGSYPAAYLATIKTMESLKGKLQSVKGSLGVSRGLITLQFLIASFIFTVTLIVSKQVSYFTNVNLGYDKSNVLIVSSVPRIWNKEGFDKMDAAKAEFETSSAISEASLSWGSPNFNFEPYSGKISHIGHPLENGVLAAMSTADQDYAKVYGLDLIAGKFFFDKDETYTPNHLVINETMQKALSIQVGDKVKMQFFENKEFTVVGVVKDFHFETLQSKVKPVVLIHTRDFGAYRFFSFKIKPGDLPTTINEVERVWHKVFPNDPFDYSFTDNRFPIIYKTEFQLKKAAVIGSIIILVVVLTGVLGLVSLSVAKRTKEIGIRKTLGASSVTILSLISREYTVFMLIAFIVGVPASYYFCWQWLNGFAYHIALAWWMFLLPILSLFAITIIVISGQSLKTALSNPVDSLRCE